MYRQLRKELNDSEIPLLTRSELALLDEVNATVEDSVNSSDWEIPNDKEKTIEVVLQLSKVEENLDLLIKHLRHGKLSNLLFVETYPMWKQNREDCMVRLKEISDSIHSDKFKCKVSKIVGYSTALLGGLVSAVSTIAIPVTFTLSTPLAVAGGGMVAAGCAAAVGTSITEVILLKNKVEQAKQLIVEDKNRFEDLSSWINDASDLQNAVESILGIDIMQDIVKSMHDLVKSGIDMENDKRRFIFIEKEINLFLTNFKPRFQEKCIPLTVIITIVRVCVAVLLLLLNAENRLVFNCASVTIRSFLGEVSLRNEATDITSLSARLATSGMAAAHARAFTMGGITTFGILLDLIGVFGVLWGSKDISNQSLCPEADKIIETIVKMKEEADAMEKLYNNISKISA